MIIQTISKQHTGGATKKKDQAEWTNDGPSVVRVYFWSPRKSGGIPRTRYDPLRTRSLLRIGE